MECLKASRIHGNLGCYAPSHPSLSCEEGLLTSLRPWRGRRQTQQSVSREGPRGGEGITELSPVPGRGEKASPVCGRSALCPDERNVLGPQGSHPLQLNGCDRGEGRRGVWRSQVAERS